MSLHEGCVVVSKGAKLAGHMGSHATWLETELRGWELNPGLPLYKRNSNHYPTAYDSMPIHMAMVSETVSFWRFGPSNAKEKYDSLILWLSASKGQTYLAGAGRRSSSSLS